LSFECTRVNQAAVMLFKEERADDFRRYFPVGEITVSGSWTRDPAGVSAPPGPHSRKSLWCLLYRINPPYRVLLPQPVGLLNRPCGTPKTCRPSETGSSKAGDHTGSRPLTSAGWPPTPSLLNWLPLFRMFLSDELMVSSEWASFHQINIFLPSFLPSFLHSFLPSFLPSYFMSTFPSFLPISCPPFLLFLLVPFLLLFSCNHSSSPLNLLSYSPPLLPPSSSSSFSSSSSSPLLPPPLLL